MRLSQDETSEKALTPTNSENDEVFWTTRKGSRGYTRTCAFIFLILLGSIFCAILGYEAHRFSLPSSTSPTKFHCGNSSEEAQALGCKFDLLTKNWIPEYCYESQTDAEFRAWMLEEDRDQGTWSAFFHDKKAQNRVSSEQELSQLVGKRFYSTAEEHLGHCIFLARRIHRLLTGDFPIAANNPLSHTMHCTQAILKAINSTIQPSPARLGPSFRIGVVPCLDKGERPAKGASY